MKEMSDPDVEVAQYDSSHPMTRRDALEAIIDLIGDSNDFIVSTTGYTSRELYAIQQQRRKGPSSAIWENFTWSEAWGTRYLSHKG